MYYVSLFFSTFQYIVFSSMEQELQMFNREVYFDCTFSYL